jgi:hypothetical protein
VLEKLNIRAESTAEGNWSVTEVVYRYGKSSAGRDFSVHDAAFIRKILIGK